jgi:cell division topological specificity factor
MKNDIVTVISRYFVIDRDKLELDITRKNDLSALMFNTPIISAKPRHQS